MEAGPMDQLLGSAITYRIAVGPHQGRKVFTLQTLPACDEPLDMVQGALPLLAITTSASRTTATNTTSSRERSSVMSADVALACADGIRVSAAVTASAGNERKHTQKIRC